MRNGLRFLRKHLWRYRAAFVIGMCCLALKDLAQAAQPLMIRDAIDSLGAGPARFLRYAGLLAGLAVVKAFFQYWMRVILIGISRDIEFDIRNDLFARLVTLAPDYFGRTRTGDIMARATNDLNAVRMMLGPGIMYWFETGLTFVLAIVIMCRTDWHLALLALLPAPAVSCAVAFFGRSIHDRFERIQAIFSDISSRVQENLAGVRMVRAFVQERAEMKRFEELNRRYVAQNIKLVRVQGVFDALLELLIGLDVSRSRVGWRPTGARRAHFARQLRHVQHLYGHAGVADDRARLGGEPDAERLGVARTDSGDSARAAVDRRAGAAAEMGALSRRDRFPQRSSGLWRPAALDEVNLKIPAGATVAIVGRTGAGKTTLAAMIPRLLDPVQGAVEMTASICARQTRRICARTSALCRRRLFSSAPPLRKTSHSEQPTRAPGRFAARPRSRDWRTISKGSRTASIPWWGRGHHALRRPETADRHRAGDSPQSADPGAGRCALSR